MLSFSEDPPSPGWCDTSNEGRFEAIWHAAYRAAQGALEAERKGCQSQLQQAEAERDRLREEASRPKE